MRANSLIVDTVLTNAKAYVRQEIVDCSLAIDDGRIFRIGKEAGMPNADTRMDLKNLLVLPGLIDVHVHLRDEGKAYKEDFYSGTAAAAAGGMTTVLDMPNNNPVTMSAEALRNRIETARNKIVVDVGFYSEFPKDTKEIRKIVDEGAIAFKLFMAEQVGGLNIDDDNALSEAFGMVEKLRSRVAVHAEDRTTLIKVEEKLKQANRNDVEAFLAAHSEDVEVKAVERLLRIVEQTKVHLHFCHTSTERGLNAIVEGKDSGLPITCEVTPHHLLLSTDDLRRAGTIAVGVPPIRQKHNAEALWKGIKNGWIDVIASDHAPHMLEEKQRMRIWDVKVGAPELEITLPLLLTEVNRGRLSIADIARLMAENPAEIFGLKGKGFLGKNCNADLTVVDLKRDDRIDATEFHSKAKFSPFDQWKVKGKPVRTFVGGQLVMDEDEIVAKAGTGRIVRREQSL
jgi:dihydroorotase (multifunctional complex type)